MAWWDDIRRFAIQQQRRARTDAARQNARLKQAGRRANSRGSVSPRTSSPPRVNPPTLRTGPSGSVNNSGGYNSPIRSTPSGRYSSPAPAKPAAPSISKFLTRDSTYQNQLRQYQNSLQQFLADVTRRRGNLQSEYGTSKKALGDQRTEDLDLMQDDFGARGILRSGLYGESVGDYEKEYGERVSNLERQQKQALSSLDAEKTRYKSQNDLQRQQARAAAVRRRAEKYGL